MLEQSLGLLCKERRRHLQVTYLRNVPSRTRGIRTFC